MAKSDDHNTYYMLLFYKYYWIFQNLVVKHYRNEVIIRPVTKFVVDIMISVNCFLSNLVIVVFSIHVFVCFLCQVLYTSRKDKKLYV